MIELNESTIYDPNVSYAGDLYDIKKNQLDIYCIREQVFALLMGWA
jgi:hypothetical protein